MLESLHPKNNREQIFKTNKNSNSNDGGRSGSFFFFTQDKRFLVKTMTACERNILLKMLPNLIEHVKKQKKSGNPSMIAKIYGIYSIQLQGLKQISLFIMKNSTLKASPKNEMSLKFDLKGSKVKRRVLPLDIHQYSQRNYDLMASQVLKDRDLVYIQSFRNKDIINISMEDRRNIIATVRNDVNFLES